MSAADVVIVGGGLDGLAAACVLARAGRAVVVCEAKDRFGGLAAREEIAPGRFTAGERLAWAPPIGLYDSLDLERDGLAWRTDLPSVFVCDGEPRGLFVHETPARMWSALSAADAQLHAVFRNRLSRFAPPVRALLAGRPPALGARGLADLAQLGRHALGLRRLGARDVTELLHAAPMAVRDHLLDELPGPGLERVRIALAALAIAGTPLGPRAPGTAASLLFAELLRGPEPVGGPPALADALIACARRHGAELTARARVERLWIERGRARGVVLAGGARVEAAHVLSALDFRATVLELCAPIEAPARLEAAARAWRARGRVAVAHLALDAAPEVPSAHGEAVERLIAAPSVDALERAADDAKHGRVAARPWAEMRFVPAPAGAVATLHVHAVPEHADGDDVRARVRDAALDLLARVAPEARVVADRVRLPRDLEREHRLTGGHLHGGELALDQLWVQRPAVLAARYATPLPGLWYGGASAHPGGALPGGAGVLAARALLADASSRS